MQPLICTFWLLWCQRIPLIMASIPPISVIILLHSTLSTNLSNVRKPCSCMPTLSECLRIRSTTTSIDATGNRGKVSSIRHPCLCNSTLLGLEFIMSMVAWNRFQTVAFLVWVDSCSSPSDSSSSDEEENDQGEEELSIEAASSSSFPYSCFSSSLPGDTHSTSSCPSPMCTPYPAQTIRGQIDSFRSRGQHGTEFAVAKCGHRFDLQTAA